MSIRVESSRFVETVATFDSGILIGRHHRKGIRVLTVDPEFDADATGRIWGLHGTIVDAIKHNPDVTIVWQPRIRHGWTLIYDGTVRSDSPRLAGHVDGELTVEFVSAMLHRPAAHSDGPEWQWPGV